jgi:hypothetical protein
MFLAEGFQKFAGIPFGISRIFESLMLQQISANRRKNRSIQVLQRRQTMNKKKLKTKLFILILSFFVLPVNHTLANSVEPVVEIDHPLVMNKELRTIYALVQFKVTKIKEDPELIKIH